MPKKEKNTARVSLDFPIQEKQELDEFLALEGSATLIALVRKSIKLYKELYPHLKQKKPLYVKNSSGEFEGTVYL